MDHIFLFLKDALLRYYFTMESALIVKIVVVAAVAIAVILYEYVYG